MNTLAFKTYIDGLKDLQGAISRQVSSKGLWEAAQSVMTLYHHATPGDLASLSSVLSKELNFATWMASLSEATFAHKAISAAEILAANIDVGGDTSEIGEEVSAVLGEERMGEGSLFVEWMDEHVPSFNVESGHLMLAKALGKNCVYHAGKSGSKGVHEIVWEKVARRWEWMVEHPGGFHGAGQELIAIGREKVGSILRQNATLSAHGVALRISAQGGDGMGSEVRDVVGVEPFAGWSYDAGLEMRLTGHSSAVFAVCDLGDGRIATGGWTKDISIWELSSGKAVKILQGHRDSVRALVQVKNGPLSSGADDPALRVWDVDSGTCQQIIEVSDIIYGLTLVGENHLVGCGEDGGPFVWKLSQGVVQEPSSPRLLEGHKEDVRCVMPLMSDAQHPRIVSGGGDGVILIHDLESGSVVGEMKLPPSSGWVRTLAVLPDGRIISGSESDAVYVWPAEHGSEPEIVLDKFPTSGGILTVLSNGVIAGAQSNGYISLFTLGEDGNQPQLVGISGGANDQFWCITPLDGGRRFVTADERGSVDVWTASRFRHEDRTAIDVTAGTVMLDGRIATGDQDGCVTVWKRPERGQEALVDFVIRETRHASAVSKLAPIHDGLAWYCEVGLTIHIHQFGRETTTIHVQQVSDLMSMDGGLTLLWLDVPGLNVWDVEARSISRKLDAKWGTVMDVIDDPEIVVCGEASKIATMNLLTKERGPWLRTGLQSWFSSVVFAGERRVVAVDFFNTAWMLHLDGGPAEKLLESVGSVHAWLGGEQVLLQMMNDDDAGLQVWSWRARAVTATLPVEDLDDVRGVFWDQSRRLAVLFLGRERTWVAFEL